MKSLVSIILPTHNRAGKLPHAIDSILAQTYTNWELIIVDDGSTDGTREVVKGYLKQDARITYLRQEEGKGVHKTVSRGFREAKGTYVARIDDDDLWIDRDKLVKQVEFLEKYPEYVLVGTGMIVGDENRREMFRYVLPETDALIRKRMLAKNCFANSTVLFSREHAIVAGGYSEEDHFWSFEDYDLWLRLGQVGKMYNLPLYSTYYTVHGKSLTSTNKRTHLKVNLLLIKKYKDAYPYAWLWMSFGYLRLFLYEVFVRIPFSGLKSFLFRIYKEL